VPADVDPDVPEQRILEQSTRLGDGGFTGADLGFAPALGLESGVPGQA